MRNDICAVCKQPGATDNIRAINAPGPLHKECTPNVVYLSKLREETAACMEFITDEKPLLVMGNEGVIFEVTSITLGDG